MNDQLLLERFVSVTNLEPIADFDGMNVYSSDKVKEDFINLIDEEKVLKPIISEFSTLVHNGVINPCYTSKGIFDRIRFKLFADDMDKSTMGAFIPENNKVYIITDHNTKFLIWNQTDRVSYVTLHELMHYISTNYKKEFYNEFKTINAEFYKEFFSKMLNFEFDIAFGDEVNKYLLKNSEWKQPLAGNFFTKFKTFIDSKMNILGVHNYNDKVNLIVGAPKLFMHDTDKFFNMIQSKNDKLLTVVHCLYRTYEHFGVSKPMTIPIQELIFPSEISAVLAIKPLPSHFRCVKYSSRGN